MVTPLLRGAEIDACIHRITLARAEPSRAPSFESVGKPVRAGEDEVETNPRARSATLRVARRTAASPWVMEGRA